MTYIVDQMFPPIVTDEEDNIEYTSFNYWRDPVFEIDMDVSGSSASSTSSGEAKDKSAVSALQAIQSKPLPTIPEN